MKYDKGIKKKYRKSIEDAFAVILEKGNDEHQRVSKVVDIPPFSFIPLPTNFIRVS